MSSQRSNGLGGGTPTAPAVQLQDSEKSAVSLVPIPARRDRHTGTTSANKLESDVEQFVGSLQFKYASRIKRRPKPFKKRVLALVKLYLPPQPKRSGRPRHARITKAAEMYAHQLQEIDRGSREQINWGPIAQSCIPGFDILRKLQRGAELNKLRDAVYARRRWSKRKNRPRS